MSDTNPTPKKTAGRAPSGKLTKPELVRVGRHLREAALGGDIMAAHALSNYALAGEMSKQRTAQEAA